MSFMDDLKRWAKGEDDDDELEEELEAVSAGPGRSHPRHRLPPQQQQQGGQHQCHHPAVGCAGQARKV